MKKIFWIFTFFCLACPAHAQLIQGLSYETIKEQVNDAEGVYYYPILAKRFMQNDISLKSIDYLMLYYGFVYQEAYNPYKVMALEDSLAKLTSEKKGAEAIVLANKIQEKNPVSLTSYVEKAYSLHGTKQESIAIVELNKYRALMSTLMGSGTGDSYENPIVVISPKDAELVVLAHKLTVLSKSMNGNGGRFYDVYLVRNDKGKQYPIYFDITLPYTIGMKKLSER